MDVTFYKRIFLLVSILIFSLFFNISAFAKPVVATEGFVRDGISQLNTKINTKADASALTGFATSAQGKKADTAVQPTTLNSYLPLAGGTMTGDINAGTKKITNLGTPTAATDSATKGYVDSAVASSGGGSGGGGSVPGWSTLSAASWDNAFYGSEWTAKSNDGAYKVNGVGACLSTNAKSGSVPSASTYGLNCWCKVSSVNDVAFSGGAWVFNAPIGSEGECFAQCAYVCSLCVHYGTNYSCTRAALFTAP